MKRYLRPIGVGLLLIMVMMVMKWWMGQPSVGTAKVDAAKTTSTLVDKTTFKGVLFSFDYTSDYDTQVNEDDDKGESVILLGKAIAADKYALALRKVGYSVDQDSGVLMRRSQPANYDEEKVTWNNRPGLVFKKKDGTEITFFGMKDNWILTVALTTGGGDDKEKNLETIVDSIGP